MIIAIAMILCRFVCYKIQHFSSRLQKFCDEMLIDAKKRKKGVDTIKSKVVRNIADLYHSKVSQAVATVNYD
jgi:hypothetical protein